MLEILQGLPDNVVAVTGKGQVTRDDYDKVLVPQVKTALSRHRKIRCYYELGPDFSGFDAGAMWEDFKLGVENLTHWERVAIVTDVDWIRHATQLFRFMFSGEIRVFTHAQALEARHWIAAD